jgi:hypothetical protein
MLPSLHLLPKNKTSLLVWRYWNMGAVHILHTRLPHETNIYIWPNKCVFGHIFDNLETISRVSWISSIPAPHGYAVLIIAQGSHLEHRRLSSTKEWSVEIKLYLPRGKWATENSFGSRVWGSGNRRKCNQRDIFSETGAVLWVSFGDNSENSCVPSQNLVLENSIFQIQHGSKSSPPWTW